MRKILTSRWFVIVVVVIVVATIILLGSLPGSPLHFSKLSSGVSKLVTPIQSVIKSAADSFDDYHSAVFDGMAIREENRQLRDEIASLQYRLRQNEEAAIRYEELKNAFHIKDTFSNYDVYGASVLSSPSDEWFSSMRVDMGTENGLEVAQGLSYVVVDVDMNLVGRVIETRETESTILPLLHEGFSVSCKVNEVNGASFIVTGDTSLKSSHRCRVTGIDMNNMPKVGAEIVTSGEGGLFPEGIPIGVIVSVDDSNPLNITAVLEPYYHYDNLQDVFILAPLPKTDSEEVTTEGGEIPEA